MGHDLYNNLLESGLSQHINKATRVDNILNLIFSTNDGLVTNTESEMAELLNDYFSSVFTVENTFEIQEITPAIHNLIPLSECDFTEDTVTKTLDKIKVNKTPGPE